MYKIEYDCHNSTDSMFDCTTLFGSTYNLIANHVSLAITSLILFPFFLFIATGALFSAGLIPGLIISVFTLAYMLLAARALIIRKNFWTPYQTLQNRYAALNKSDRKKYKKEMRSAFYDIDRDELSNEDLRNMIYLFEDLAKEDKRITYSDYSRIKEEIELRNYVREEMKNQGWSLTPTSSDDRV